MSPRTSVTREVTSSPQDHPQPPRIVAQVVGARALAIGEQPRTTTAETAEGAVTQSRHGGNDYHALAAFPAVGKRLPFPGTSRAWARAKCPIRRGRSWRDFGTLHDEGGERRGAIPRAYPAIDAAVSAR